VPSASSIGPDYLAGAIVIVQINLGNQLGRTKGAGEFGIIGRRWDVIHAVTQHDSQGVIAIGQIRSDVKRIILRQVLGYMLQPGASTALPTLVPLADNSYWPSPADKDDGALQAGRHGELTAENRQGSLGGAGGDEPTALPVGGIE
jgi:hypothetical protein